MKKKVVGILFGLSVFSCNGMFKSVAVRTLRESPIPNAAALIGVRTSAPIPSPKSSPQGKLTALQLSNIACDGLLAGTLVSDAFYIYFAHHPWLCVGSGLLLGGIRGNNRYKLEKSLNEKNVQILELEKQNKTIRSYYRTRNFSQI